jgi:hypothetical protein
LLTLLNDTVQTIVTSLCREMQVMQLDYWCMYEAWTVILMLQNCLLWKLWKLGHVWRTFSNSWMT